MPLFLFSEKEISISRRDIFHYWQSCPNIDKIVQDILRRFSIENINPCTEEKLKNNLKFLVSKIKKKWQEASRYRDLFLRNNDTWLNKMFIFKYTCDVYEPLPTASGGRPIKAFDECCAKTKKHKVRDILNSRSVSELSFAAEVAVRKSGKRDAANIIREVAHSSSDIATEIKKLRMSKSTETRLFSNEEALAIFIDCKLSKNSYKLLRKQALKINHNIYPSYYQLAKAKMDCYPPGIGDMTVTEHCVNFNIQSLVDLTTKRLILAHSTVFRNLPSVTTFTMICKWGCDGSSGHSKYKQKFKDQNVDDEHLFAFSFVPLKLFELNHDENLVWSNPFPSSTRNCRPLMFMFSKETVDLTITETNKIKQQIESLQPTKITMENKEIVVHYKFLLTMIDGKVCNALTGTKSSQTCYICGATPKLMNVINRIDSNDIKENYEFGLSTLHAWIRSFECFLHISYRLNVRKWAITDDEDKEVVKNRKLEIQQKFKEEMGLIIDRPKPGFGSTNDGNTARRFFKNHETSASITGLNNELLKRFYVMLTTLASGYDIHVEIFEAYVQDTRSLYLSLYSWYYMPVTVHKLLTHSTEIIRKCIVPIGMLSEEAQECRNKDLRRFREHNTRKCSRLDTNTDLARMLLLTSDPLINSFRKETRKSRKSLNKDVLSLLRPPHLSTFWNSSNKETDHTTSSNSSSDCDSSSASDSSSDCDSDR